MKKRIDFYEDNNKYNFDLTNTDLEIEFVEPGKVCNCYAEFDDEFIEFKNNKFEEIKKVGKSSTKNFTFNKGGIKIVNNCSGTIIQNFSGTTIIRNGVVISSKEEQRMPLKLYLNKNLSYDLKIENECGDISLNNGVSIKKLDIQQMAGNVTLNKCNFLGKNKIVTKSGNITLEDCENVQALETMSGNIGVRDITDIEKINTMSGNIEVACSKLNTTKMNTMSGNVQLENIDIKHKVNIDTMSGDINLFELTQENKNKVYTNTMSGRVLKK